jgi:hypothetical protein
VEEGGGGAYAALLSLLAAAKAPAPARAAPRPRPTPAAGAKSAGLPLPARCSPPLGVGEPPGVVGASGGVAMLGDADETTMLGSGLVGVRTKKFENEFFFSCGNYISSLRLWDACS